jgi:hypothetical protein
MQGSTSSSCDDGHQGETSAVFYVAASWEVGRAHTASLSLLSFSTRCAHFKRHANSQALPVRCFNTTRLQGLAFSYCHCIVIAHKTTHLGRCSVVITGCCSNHGPKPSGFIPTLHPLPVATQVSISYPRPYSQLCHSQVSKSRKPPLMHRHNQWHPLSSTFAALYGA